MSAASWWKESQFRTPSLDSGQVGSLGERRTLRCRGRRRKRQRKEVVELAVSMYVGVFDEKIQSVGAS
jgi:hypothetical protein